MCDSGTERRLLTGLFAWIVRAGLGEPRGDDHAVGEGGAAGQVQHGNGLGLVVFQACHDQGLDLVEL